VVLDARLNTLIPNTFDAGLMVKQWHVASVPFINNPDVAEGEGGPEEGQRVTLNFSAVPGMTVPFEVEARGLVRVYGHLAMQLENCKHGERMMITVGYQLDRNWIDSGSKVGSNVDRDVHYHVIPFAWSAVVDPGPHEVRLLARALALGTSICRAYFKPSQFARMHVEVLG
jgi:hypothetical protein